MTNSIASRMINTRPPARYSPKAGADAAALCSNEPERWIVGSLLIDEACTGRVLKVVSALDFVDPSCRLLFEAIAKRYRCNEPINPQLALQDLRASKSFSEDPGLFLAQLANDTPTVAHVDLYCKQLAELSRKRRIYDAATAAAEHTCNGHSSDEVLADFFAFVENERRQSLDSSLQSLTLSQLETQYPELRPIVVDGLLRGGETLNIVSHPKVGKSWLAYGLMLSIATGSRWLDRFDTTQGRVLLIDNELHPETLAFRLPRVASAMGLTTQECGNQLSVWPLRGKLRPLEALRPQFESIEPGEFAVIILDAKYRFAEAGASENDNASEARFYNLIDEFACMTGASIVLIHHGSKGGQNDKRVTDVGAGAGAQSRAADAHLVLREHEQESAFVIEAAPRSFKRPEPMTVRFDFPLWQPADDLDPSQLKGRAKTQREKLAEREEREQKTVDDDAMKIFKLLSGEAEPRSKSDLADLAAISRGRAGKALGSLKASSLVEEVEGKRKGSINWQLTAEGRDEQAA